MAGEQYPVSVDGWIRCGWNAARERTADLYRGIALLISYQFILFLIGFLPGGIFIVMLIQLTAGVVLSVGWLNYCLSIVRGRDVKPTDILDPFGRFAPVWGVSIILSILVSVGLIFLIAPGVYILVRYGFSLFSVMDEKLSVIESLGFSEKITREHGWQLAVFYLIALGSFYAAAIIYMSGNRDLGILVMIVYHLFITPLISLIFASSYDSLYSAYEYLNLDKQV